MQPFRCCARVDHTLRGLSPSCFPRLCQLHSSCPRQVAGRPFIAPSTLFSNAGTTCVPVCKIKSVIRVAKERFSSPAMADPSLLHPPCFPKQERPVCLCARSSRSMFRVAEERFSSPAMADPSLVHPPPGGAVWNVFLDLAPCTRMAKKARAYVCMRVCRSQN